MTPTMAYSGREAPGASRDAIAGAFASNQPLAVDENGAPVTFEPAHWLVCFVPGLRSQFWHRFVHETHKHVLLLKPNMDGTWTLFEPWWTRLLVRTISTDQAMRFLHWGAMGDVLLVEEAVPGHGSQIRGWANCVSLAAFVLGRPYCVWSPHALFKRLRSEERAQRVDVADFVESYFAAQSELRVLPTDRGVDAAATSFADRFLGGFRHRRATLGSPGESAAPTA